MNHKINWVNDHTEICDRLIERLQRIQDYLHSKPDDFDGIATKRFLLGQAREQVTWYRQSIEGLDFVGAVACCRALEPLNPFTRCLLETRNIIDELPESWQRVLNLYNRYPYR